MLEKHFATWTKIGEREFEGKNYASALKAFSKVLPSFQHQPLTV